ncbi:homoserine kinase [uncultured Sphingomonas sp.]|uniref:homoserine kinase n=1 Tax=uncultured Sphingomonas sp. TaxID=158754 RepID=UPI0025EC9C14|nr:homoserine kinase [uncultured Sphingomonas sp.]
MAVYTHVSAEALADLLGRYDAGRLVSAKGIAEGVENSNYLVDTDCARFILTLYEKRVDAADLPFFLHLLDQLADAGLPVPRAIRDRSGRQIQEVAGRPACLIEFLPGVSVTTPTVAQARSAGAAMGRMHAALAGTNLDRPNALGVASWCPLLDRCGRDLDAIDPALHGELSSALDHVLARWDNGGPRTIIHADLFPDNVLMLGDDVSGLIDFYFACTDLRLYDLAIMHSAWSFDPTGTTHDPAVGRALLDGYADAFGLTPQDRAQLPVLAMGACIRFALTRAWDWLNTPADALVTRKDPLAYTRRLAFYREMGPQLFG